MIPDKSTPLLLAPWLIQANMAVHASVSAAFGADFTRLLSGEAPQDHELSRTEFGTMDVSAGLAISSGYTAIKDVIEIAEFAHFYAIQHAS